MRSQVFESLRKHDFRLILSVPVFAILITLSGCKKNPTEEAGLLGDWRARSGFDGKARQAAASFVLSTPDSKTLAYIGGGNDGDNNRLNDFWNYDNVRNTWTQVANFTGPARSSAVGFSVSNKGYVGTGIDANNARLNDFYQYDPATNKWTKVADYPGAPRYSAVAFAINGKGYVGTGYDRSNYYKDFFAYDPATNAWSIIASLSGNKREGAVAFVLNNLGYVTTGNNNLAPQTDVWAYDPAQNTWLEKAKFTTDETVQRSYGAAFTINGKAYVCNGTGNNTTWEYDPTANTWTSRNTFDGTGQGIQRQYGVGFSIGNKGYVTTGSSGSFRFDDLWEFDPKIPRDDTN